MTNEIINSSFLFPATDLETALARYKAVNDFIRHILREGVDYGIIPGAGDKPVLLKPGVEKLCSFFGLTIRIIEREAIEDWTGELHGGEPFFYYRYRIGVYRGNILIAEGEGSANSWEKKYRYRNAERICPVCGKPAIIKGREEYGGGYICYAKKGGCGARFADDAPEIVNQQVGLVKNPDSADLVNTLQKIAQKRALTVSVLLATNTSEYFTQDIDDSPKTWSTVHSSMTVEEAGQVQVNTASGMHKMSDFANEPEKLGVIAASAKNNTVREAASILLDEYQRSNKSESPAPKRTEAEILKELGYDV